MTVIADSSSHSRAKYVDGLRINAFAGVVTLVLEFGLGISVNLYSTLPGTHAGTSLPSAFRESVTEGPLLLGAHAVLGTLLLLTGIAALVRAVLSRRHWTIGVTSVALIAIVTAWISGSTFVAGRNNGASLSMALATGVALLCYALVLFLVPSTNVDCVRK